MTDPPIGGWRTIVRWGPMPTLTTWTLATFVTATLVATPAAATTPEEKCQAGKNLVGGKYVACLTKAEKTFVLTGDYDNYTLAATACGDKFNLSWDRLEQAAVDAGTLCPTTGDSIDIREFLEGGEQDVAAALGGAALPPEGGLARTGQTGCYNAAGGAISCVGTGQDGDTQTGIPRAYTDNGDGTITDGVNGLTWEKLSDDGSIHDWDTQYTWADAVSIKIATLNATNFAGHNDWRLPNLEELESLRHLGTYSPAVYPVFHTGCTPGCLVTSCSCTKAQNTWSSTTFQGSTNMVWFVSFLTGQTGADLRSGTWPVRAVRGGQ